ncbi:MAG: NADP-dependent phosphogluconate dehydrogenase [Pseudomonadota bacterium]
MTVSLGLSGLGTMGAALALNLADKGFDLVVQNRTVETAHRFVAEAGALAPRLRAVDTPADLVAALAPPRAILLMVPAGQAVDDAIATILPLLGPDDVLIDGGNANFRDTKRRAAGTAHLIGLGVSGGEEGARHGPSMMGGGEAVAWERVAPVLEAIAARYEGTPCAARFGPGGAGHFVKTVHNGIEYADMALIAEIYGILRDGFGWEPARIGDLFARWNTGPLKSYLVEITAAVAGAADTETGRPILDVILDRAGQKGTGRWTAIEAQTLGVAVPAIEAAVASRNISAELDLRRQGEARFGPAPVRLPHDALSEGELEAALIGAKIMAYVEGFALLRAASAAEGWGMPLGQVARVWRAGCIIRSDMLNDMAAAFDEDAERPLFLAPAFAEHLAGAVGPLRAVVATGIRHGLSVPALSAALSHFEMLRTERSTANMLQGLRDYFGRHGFERTDQAGAHHGPWAEG